jgi:hypothetical protein
MRLCNALGLSVDEEVRVVMHAQRKSARKSGNVA